MSSARMSSRYDAAPATELRAPAATTELTQIVRALQSPRTRGHITATTHARGITHRRAPPARRPTARTPFRTGRARGDTRQKCARRHADAHTEFNLGSSVTLTRNSIFNLDKYSSVRFRLLQTCCDTRETPATGEVRFATI
jgi:hypothetical protein